MSASSGIRFTLVRDPGSTTATLTYRGTAVSATENVSLVIVAEDGAATATIDSAEPSEIERSIGRQAAALVRAAVRSPDGEARPPQKIVRWRAMVGEKPRG